MSKRFDFIANVEIFAENQKQAEKIMDEIKFKGEFPDGSIVDNTFNITSWKTYQRTKN